MPVLSCRLDCELNSSAVTIGLVNTTNNIYYTKHILQEEDSVNMQFDAQERYFQFKRWSYQGSGPPFVMNRTEKCPSLIFWMHASESSSHL